MNVVTWEVDTSKFDQMVGELSAVCGSPPDEVLREELGRALSQAIKDTKAADVASIKQHSANAKFAVMPASLYAPKNRRIAGRTVLYNLKRRYPPKLWAAIQQRRAIDLKRRLAARGLAKQSFYKIGLLLGLAVEAPAYVKKAVATTGKTYRDERTQVTSGNASKVITIESSQPTLVAIGGQQVLQRAINGRAEYFYTNVSKGVFDSMWKAAKKYTGLYVIP